MIINKHIKKTINLLLISLISMSTNVMVGYSLNGEHSEQINIDQTSTEDGYQEKKGCGLFTSSVSASSNISSEISVKVYDMQGNAIDNDNFIISPENAAKAGTWVGINIQEKYSGSYSSGATSKEIVYVPVCKYTCEEICGTDSKGNPQTCTVEATLKDEEKEDCDKDSYECRTRGNNCTVDGPKFEKKTRGAGGYESDLETRIDNYISDQIKDSVSNNIGDIYFIPVNDYDKFKKEKLKATKVVSNNGHTATYTYFPNKVCMNLKTGDVTYYKDECNINNNEIEIKNGIAKDGNEYWHYFIPLNMKSSQIFSIEVVGNKVYTSGECAGFKSSGGGNVIKPSGQSPSIIPDSEASVEGSGCTISLSVEIPVIQRFYKEINNGTKFKGFNFYYKPINIDDPFPNGLSNTSEWYDWNKSSTKNPDISKSYNDITYAVLVGLNGEKIRNYKTLKEENTEWEKRYTAWDDTNIYGKNKFIDYLIEQDIAKRNETSYYKLGCGRANEKSKTENGQTNYLYREWCGKS